MFPNFEEFSKLGKTNMELAMKSFGAVAQGMQAIAIEVADHSRKSFEDGSQAVERLMGARSLDTAVEVQTSYAKGAAEAFVARATRIGELVADTAKESYRPFEGTLARASAAVR